MDSRIGHQRNIWVVKFYCKPSTEHSGCQIWKYPNGFYPHRLSQWLMPHCTYILRGHPKTTFIKFWLFLWPPSHPCLVDILCGILVWYQAVLMKILMLLINTKLTTSQRIFWRKIYFTPLVLQPGGQVGCLKQQNSSRN